MKRIAILSVFALFALPALPSAILRAQESDRTASAAAPGAVNADARIKTLEDEVRSLAEQVALLRGELTTLRDAKSPTPVNPCACWRAQRCWRSA